MYQLRAPVPTDRHTEPVLSLDDCSLGYALFSPECRPLTVSRKLSALIGESRETSLAWQGICDSAERLARTTEAENALMGQSLSWHATWGTHAAHVVAGFVTWRGRRAILVILWKMADVLDRPRLRRLEPRLSAREAEVALLLAEGCSAKEIAGRLGSSIHTVRRQTERLYQKLSVRTRAAAAVAVRERFLGAES
jgi:DNA-binding CsgD family transcriptional regulator